jgi:hypothetical protein
MNKISLPNLIIVSVVMFIYFITPNAFAAELNFKVIPSKIGDKETVVEVLIDPQSKILNVVEGVISFLGPATENLSVQIENGNSILPLWPTPPQYEPNEKTISFTGGVPDGFDDEGLLFIMRLSSPVVGDLDISYTDGYAYLNDGQGTKENIFSQPLKLNLNQSNDSDVKKENLFFNQNKYVILLLILMVLGSFVFYGYKKVTKN